MAKKVKKSTLGLGIKAILSDFDDGKEDKRNEIVKELNREPHRIPVDDIEPNPYQPRTNFNEAELRELAISIGTLDVIQPLTVRSIGNGKYQLISGERRLRASKLAGLKDVPAYVRTADDQGMIEMAIVENIQRSNLNPIETAIAFKRLMDEVGLTHEQLSDRVGKQRSTITNTLRLLNLPPEVQQALIAKNITSGHGRALAGLNSKVQQVDLLHQIEEQGLSVRQTEERVKNILSPKQEADNQTNDHQIPSRITAVLTDIQKELTGTYGAKVKLKRSDSGKGQFIINFKNDDEFNRILDQLRG